MSLINDVLKDLDNRHSNDQPIRRSGGRRPPPLQPVERGRRPVPAIAAGAVLGGVILVMLGFWSGLFETTEAKVPASDGAGVSGNAVTQNNTVTHAKVLVPANPVEPAVGSAQVLAVTVSQGSRGEQLELLLSRAVAHRLQDRGDTQLVIHLPATRLQAHLPDVANSRLIEAIDIQQNDADLLMQISLANKAGVQTYLLSEGSRARLVVELFNTSGAQRATAGAAQAEQTSLAQRQLDPESAASPASEPLVAKQSEPLVEQVQASFSKTAKQVSPAELDRATSDEALELARRGQVRAAIRKLEGFTVSAQSHQQASGTLATLLLSSGKLQDAMQVLVSARARYTEDRTLQKLQARILLEQGSYGQALAVLDDAPLETMDAEHLALRASLQQRTGAHEQAVSSYERLLAQHGEEASWLVGRAISLEALGQGDNARTTYQQALRISEIDARLKAYASDRLKALN